MSPVERSRDFCRKLFSGKERVRMRQASVFTDTAVQFGHWPARFLEQEEPSKKL